MSTKQRTNIIYLTTKCNLACAYCYEGNGDEFYEKYPHVFVSNEQIDEFVNEMEIREGSVASSSISFMGGEPSLAYDQLVYFVDRIIASSKKMNKQYHAVFTTNGILLDTPEYYKKFIALLEYSRRNGFYINVEISYDGVGQDLRVFPNGISTKDTVLRVINKLESDGHKFRISCTVSEKNYNVIVEQVILFLESYKNLINVTCSIAFERLDQFLGPDAGFRIRRELKPYMKELYKIYDVPICGLACGACTRCNKENFEGNRYMSPTKGLMLGDEETVGKFEQF